MMIRDDQIAWLKLAWREGLSAADAGGLAAVPEAVAKRWFSQFAADGLPRLRDMAASGKRAMIKSRNAA